MAVIRKKSYPPYFEHVRNGKKRFDVRLADFDAQPGDTIIFEEYDPHTRQPTGRTSEHKIGYVLRTKDAGYWTRADIEKFGLMVMGLE
ncbi:MAG: DUF3850 domain-containing protein [Rickettsiales bacterium]|nr:DUF3850 domain-containing protein [Rickettsiales bacterium]